MAAATRPSASAALYNTTSYANTAIGLNALFHNTTGNGNTGVGTAALATNATGSNNTVLGAEAGSGVTGDSNICIGQGVSGVAGENNTIRIGDNLPSGMGQSACYVGGIYEQGFNNTGVLQVGIDSTGKVGTFISSRRFKRDIQAMDKASEAILALKPVTFHYKSDATNTPCFGLVAEEVAEVNRDLIVRDKEGKPHSVRYAQVNAMLLNEFLKEHRKVQELEATVAQLKNDLQATATREQKQIDALSAALQKVSAQLELSTPAPETVLNSQ
jgi:hypothetical protein